MQNSGNTFIYLFFKLTFPCAPFFFFFLLFFNAFPETAGDPAVFPVGRLFLLIQARPPHLIARVLNVLPTRSLCTPLLSFPPVFNPFPSADDKRAGKVATWT